MPNKLIVAFILFCNTTYAQKNIPDSLTQNELTLAYWNKSTPYDFRLIKNHQFNKNKIQLCFFDHFNDSISVYLNGNLVSSRWSTPDPVSKIQIVMLNAKRKKANYVKIVLNNAKKYIEFPLDKRYHFVELHFDRDNLNDNDLWNVVFTNNVPHRD